VPCALDDENGYSLFTVSKGLCTHATDEIALCCVSSNSIAFLKWPVKQFFFFTMLHCSCFELNNAVQGEALGPRSAGGASLCSACTIPPPPPPPPPLALRPQCLSRSSSSLLHWVGWLQWQKHGCESQQEQTVPLNSLPGRYQRDVGNRLVREIKPDFKILLSFSTLLLHRN